MDPIELIRQGKIKRYFRATRKLTTPNLVSHITQRAAGKDLLFLEDNDFLYMLALLKEISAKYAVSIYALCLMPNHVHLLLKPTQRYLHDAMRDLFSRYAMRFNRKYQRRGHLFGGPYRQAVCLDESYLLAVSLYIHLNPARAGITRDPLKYRWSSCALYCRQNSPKSFVDTNFILDTLSSGKADAKKTYRNLLKRGAHLDIKEVMEDKDAIEQFAVHIASRFPSLFNKVGKNKRITGSLGIDLMSLDTLEKQIVLMKSNNIRKPETIPAKRYLIGQLISRGYSRKEIAQRLGISRKGVYNLLKSSKSPLA